MSSPAVSKLRQQQDEIASTWSDETNRLVLTNLQRVPQIPQEQNVCDATSGAASAAKKRTQCLHMEFWLP